VIYDAEALFAEREALRSQVLGTPLPSETAELQFKREIALAEKARTVVTVNKRAAEAFKSAGHADVRILNYAVEQQLTHTSFDERDGFLFVGPTFDDDTPNSDSIVWFTDHVLPAIQQAMGRPVPLVLAGMQTSGQIAARLNGSVQSLGALSDLTAVYSAARVFVAPTRFAAGIPIKVYDAAARGVPVVLTPVLAEQIDWRHEQEGLVAASPQEFVTQCQRLHNDRDLWEHVRSRALGRVTEDCDSTRFNSIVADLLAEVAGRRRDTRAS
jgi:glycosyltransferase involved in cell wall biosynthesis